MELKDLLLMLTTGAGSGAVAYWAIANIGFLRDLGAEPKRYVAFLLPPALAVAGYGLMVLLGYQATPSGVKEWLEAFVFIVANLYTSQTIHARVDLSKVETGANV